MTRGHIALGGNVGDVPTAFRAAFDALAGPDLRVVAVSRLFATPPMGADAGGTFLNAAATVETSLDPLALLDRLLAAEDVLGRTRGVRWGPRPIDLDLVFFADSIIDRPRLRVPHPGCWYRRFVLDPLADIAPDAVHPETGETIAELRDRLLVRPLRIAVLDPGESPTRLGDVLRREFPEIELVSPDDDSVVLTLEPGGDATSAAGRRIALPSGDQTLDAARAVLTAALGEPEPAGAITRTPV